MKNDLRLDTKLLGSVLRRTRELARIPFRQLASDSGVSTSQIMRIESGEFDCHVSSLISLCGALGIRFGELLQRCVLADSWIYREALNREIKSNYPAHFPQNAGAKLSCKHLALGACITLVDLMRSLDANKSVNELTFPSVEISDLFQRIARGISIHPPDLRTRWDFFAMLQLDPLATLIRFYRFPSLKNIVDHLKSRPDLEAGNDEMVPTWMPTLERDMIALSEESSMSFLVGDKKTELTNTESSAKSNTVKAQLPEVLGRVKQAASAPGKKTELASFLKAPLASVSRWLSGEREPGGEIALKMDAWATDQGYPKKLPSKQK